MKRYIKASHDDAADKPLSKMLNLLTERNKPSMSSIVSNPTLAEKVEPGYLVKLASEIENANNFVFHAACGQLKLIEEQMALLKNQAVEILIETKINAVLNSLTCNFSKKPNHVYSVYQKPEGSYYISMISPEEWGCGCPHKFVGSYLFESSMKWKPVDENSASSAVRCWVQNVEKESRMLEDVSMSV